MTGKGGLLEQASVSFQRYKYYKEYEDHLNAKYRALLDLALEKTKVNTWNFGTFLL